jgi:phosphohistidine phosphatase
MRLYVLRHAIAEERGTGGYADEDRPLTKDGVRKMRAAARGMRAMDLEFDRILSSPYLRARQTADIVASVFSGKVEIWESLKAEVRPQSAVAALAKVAEDRILIVGHQPHLGSLVSLLIAGADVQINLKKGGLCLLTMEAIRPGPCATLEWLLAPSQLRRNGRQ